MIPALRSRVVAGILVLFTFMGTTGAWHAGNDDDVDFVTASAHDHSAHHERLNAASRSQTPSHCAICHWLQGFRTDALPGIRVVNREVALCPVSRLRRHPVQHLVRADVPSRAPPAQAS